MRIGRSQIGSDCDCDKTHLSVCQSSSLGHFGCSVGSYTIHRSATLYIVSGYSNYNNLASVAWIAYGSPSAPVVWQCFTNLSSATGPVSCRKVKQSDPLGPERTHPQRG